MATIKAFNALRPAPEVAAAVSAVPYDVVTTAEARALAAGNPLSFLHVSRAEIDLPDETDAHSDQVYQKAAENFSALRERAPLTVESAPALYCYRLKMGSHEQAGIAAACSIDEYDRDVIKKHERTRKDKEDDRTRHMIELGAQTGPVFLTYPDHSDVDEIIAAVKTTDPLYDFEAPDGVHHTIWRVGPALADKLTFLFQGIPSLYIADGHHRAASASRARANLQAASPGHNGQESYNYFLTVAFPASQVQILAYNRTASQLNGLSADGFLKALAKSFDVVDEPVSTPLVRGQISFYIDGRWRLLKIRPESLDKSDPISSLDVSILQERVLDDLLGIKDVRTDPRIEFVGGIKGASGLQRMVDSGRAAVAFSMYPVSVRELIAISDAGQIMPPKSTWFEPKLRDGLLIHLI